MCRDSNRDVDMPVQVFLNSSSLPSSRDNANWTSVGPVSSVSELNFTVDSEASSIVDKDRKDCHDFPWKTKRENFYPGLLFQTQAPY